MKTGNWNQFFEASPESIIEELLEKVIEAVTEVGEFILISGARNVKTFKISNPNLDSTQTRHINYFLIKVKLVN